VQYETVSLAEAERMTGLPVDLIGALAACGELPAEQRGGELYIGKSALFGWCRLFAKILAAVTSKDRSGYVSAGISARNLVWLSQAGLLTGKDRLRL